MSIERDWYYPLDQGYTIKSMSGIRQSDSVETEYTIKEFIHLVNAGFELTYSTPFNGVVLIRAKIPTGASGYLMGKRRGDSDSNESNMFIKVENNVVTWNIKGVSYTHALEEGIHDYGFVGGYAVYDNKKVLSTQTPASGVGYLPALVIGGCMHYTNSASDGSKTYMSDVYIYRVDIDCYGTSSPTSTTTPILSRYYPTSATQMRDALKLGITPISRAVGTNGSSDITGATDVTYGVQLDDLKYIFGSKYRDLLAIICEDGGVDVRSGQDDPDDPYQIVYNTTTHNFAFDLRHTDYPGGTTTGSESEDRGALKLGRKPLWDIWQDSVAHGFYIRIVNNALKLVYNIFRKANGSITDVKLEWFDGYDTDPDKTHAPKIVFGSGVTEAYIEYHNGQNFRCSEADLCVPYDSGGGRIDDKCLFYAKNVADLDYHVILGNAIPWNVNQADLGDTTRGVYYYVIGGGVALTLFGDTFAITDSIEYDSNNNPVMMCADQPSDATLHAQLKNKYQKNGFTGSLVLEYLAPAVRTELVSHNNQTPVEAEAVLYCFHNNTRTTVSLQDLLKKTALTLRGAFNTKIGDSQSITNRRQIVSEDLTKSGSTTKYLAHLITSNNGGYDAHHESSNASDPEIMIAAFQECNSGGTALLEVTSDLYALIAIDIADESDTTLCAEHHECMVNVITGLAFSGAYAYSAGTRGHAVEDFARGHIYNATQWYKNKTQVGGTTYQSQYSCYAAASPRDLGLNQDVFNSTDLDNMNIRFSIFRADNNPFLAKFEGEWIGKASTMALKSTNGTYYYVCRTPGQRGVTTTKQICDMLARKYSKSGTTWTPIETFDFAQKILLRRKRAASSSYETINTFNFSGASGSGNTRYVDYTITGTSYVIRAEVSLVESTDPLNGPNGYPVTVGNYGAIKYYEFKIYYTSSSTDMQVGDTYEISLVD